ncbi:MAG: hypothetical protein Fur0022_12500 [Anaerolineales bacterium]
MNNFQIKPSLAYFFLLTGLFFAGCTSPKNFPTPTLSPISVEETISPPVVASQTPLLPTLALTPTSSSAPSPLPSFTPALFATTSPDWSGDWDVYLSSPRLSIVKTIQFQVPVGESTTISAFWVEGTRSVSFEGDLSTDRRTLSGKFYNTDVDVYEFTIALSPDGLSFSGPMTGEAGNGAFCGTRPGLPRPNPCGQLP